MRIFSLTDWLVAILTPAIVVIGVAFSWAIASDAPPFITTLNFDTATDFLYALVVVGPVLIFVLNMTDIPYRPVIVFFLAIATLVPFLQFAGSLVQASLSADTVLFNDRFWIMRLLSAAFWVQMGLAVLLIIVTGLDLRRQSAMDELDDEADGFEEETSDGL